MIETVTYSDGTTATGTAPLPKRSPLQQERDHVCSLRRQLKFLEGRPISSGHTRREIPALRWAIEILERRNESAGIAAAPTTDKGQV